MKNKNQKGQALVMLLFFIMVGIMVTTAAILIIAGNSLAATSLQEGETARVLAESGAEKALLKILRGDYSNETISSLPDGTVDIQITNGTPIDVISTGTAGSYIKKVEVKASFDVNNELQLISWKDTN